MLFALEIRSSEGELWVRRVGDYFVVAHMVMDVMNSQKFRNEGWAVTIKGTPKDDSEDIGSLKIFD